MHVFAAPAELAGVEGCSLSDLVQPRCQRTRAKLRCLLSEGQESRLERVLGFGRIAKHVAAHIPDTLAMTPDDSGEGAVVATIGEGGQEFRVTRAFRTPQTCEVAEVVQDVRGQALAHRAPGFARSVPPNGGTTIWIST